MAVLGKQKILWWREYLTYYRSGILETISEVDEEVLRVFGVSRTDEKPLVVEEVQCWRVWREKNDP